MSPRWSSWSPLRPSGSALPLLLALQGAHRDAVDHWQGARRLAIGDGGGFEHQPMARTTSPELTASPLSTINLLESAFQGIASKPDGKRSGVHIRHLTLGPEGSLCL